MKKILVGLIFIVLLLIAGCKSEKHQLHFDVVGGVSIESITFTNVQDIVLPENPSRDGYTFDGWFLDEEYTTEFGKELFDLQEKEVVLYAKWVENLSDLDIQLMSIYNLALAADSFDGTYEEWLETIRGPGGIPGEDGLTPEFTVSDGQLMWRYIGESTWTLLYDLALLNGEDGVDGTDGLNGTDGTNGLSAYELYLQQFPEYDGTLEEWIDEFFSIPTINTYTITFDANGGSDVSSQLVSEGQKGEVPNQTIKQGYVFDGWYIADSDVEWIFEGYVVTENVSLKAHWIKNDLTYEGLYDKVVEVDSVVDLSFNINVYDILGSDLTSELIISSDNCTITDGILDTSSTGSCDIDYGVSTSGLTDQAHITVDIVLNDLILGDYDVVESWTFQTSADLSDWNTHTGTNGQVYLNIYDYNLNNALRMDVTSGDDASSPQVSYDSLKLEKGNYYTVSMKMMAATSGKKVHVTVGEFLDNESTFFPYKVDFLDIYTLSNDWENYSFTFQMTRDTSVSSLVFNLGDMVDSEDVSTPVVIDDLVITESDELVQENIYTVSELYDLSNYSLVNVIGTVMHVIDDTTFAIEDLSGDSIIVKSGNIDDILFLTSQILYPNSLVHIKGYYNTALGIPRIEGLKKLQVLDTGTRAPEEDFTIYTISDIWTIKGDRGFGRKYRLNPVVVYSRLGDYTYYRDATGTTSAYLFKTEGYPGSIYPTGTTVYNLEVVFYWSSSVNDTSTPWDAYIVQ